MFLVYYDTLNNCLSFVLIVQKYKDLIICHWKISPAIHTMPVFGYYFSVWKKIGLNKCDGAIFDPEINNIYHHRGYVILATNTI